MTPWLSRVPILIGHISSMIRLIRQLQPGRFCLPPTLTSRGRKLLNSVGRQKTLPLYLRTVSRPILTNGVWVALIRTLQLWVLPMPRRSQHKNGWPSTRMAWKVGMYIAEQAFLYLHLHLTKPTPFQGGPLMVPTIIVITQVT